VKAAALERDAALLELLADLLFDVLPYPAAPGLPDGQRLLRDFRLGLDEFDADRRLVEGDDLAKLARREALGEYNRDLVERLLLAFREFRRGELEDLLDDIRMLGLQLHEGVLDLLHDQGQDQVELLSRAGCLH